MNSVLRQVAVDAGAPEEMLDQLWFNVFCMKFAHFILEMAENDDE